jgi:hypothetical protein
MTIITDRLTVHSEDGDKYYPASVSLEITMDGTQPTCPVTFWHDDKAVFTLGNDEIPAFIKALSSFDCSNT